MFGFWVYFCLVFFVSRNVARVIMDEKKTPFSKFVVNRLEYWMERSSVLVTSVPGGKSMRDESRVNIIRDIMKAAFVSIKSSI